jgi:hypothetical protein
VPHTSSAAADATQRNHDANSGFQVKNILHRAAFESRPSGHLEEPAPVAIGRLAVALRTVQVVNIQLLMPESHGCLFDSDSDPESYDIHAGSG